MDSPSYLADRVAVLERLLNLNDPTLQSIFHLSEGCANLLGLLISCDNVPVKLDGSNDLGGIVNPRTTVKRLRTQLAPYNIEVHNRRGEGYYLTAEDRAAVRALIDRERPRELPLSFPENQAPISERERLSVLKCVTIPTEKLADPDLVLVPVPQKLVRGVRWLVEAH